MQSTLKKAQFLVHPKQIFDPSYFATALGKKVEKDNKARVKREYRTRAIVICGLYIFTPFFSAAFNQE